MDFYLDFMRALEKSPDPEATLQELTDAVKSAIEQVPARVGLVQGAALLAVIHDYQNPKAIQTISSFRDITESVELLLAALDADLDLEKHLWGEEGEDSSLPRRIDDPNSESGGLPRYFLDFDGIETWGKARWIAFVAHIDMAIDIATTAQMGVDSMVRLLAKIRDNFDRIPVESQEQALAVADRLMLAIRDQTETIMDTMQDKHQINLISESMDVTGWYGEDDSMEDFTMEPPNIDEAAAFFTSELRPKLDLSGWRNWSEEDWSIFDQAVVDAQAAAAAEPSDTAPAMHLFIGIRQNIETLEWHRRFAMGNTADDLLEAIKKGMAQDLFQIQKKCPYAPRPVPITYSNRDAVQLPPECTVAPTPDGSDRGWKRGRVGRELVELNFDHLGEWSLSQWAALKIHSDKLTAAAETTADALGQPGQLLEDIRAHIQQIPLHYMEDISQIATQLAQAIIGRTSDALTEILQGSGQSDIADRS